MNKIKLSLILQIFLGLIFIISAYSKFISHGIIEIILVDYKIASTRETAAIYSNILIALEFALGFLLLQNNFIKKIILPISFLFLLIFSIYLIYTGYFVGDNQNCGCFGTMIEISPTESLIKNIVLMIIAFFAYTKIKNESKNIYPLIIIVIISFAFVFSFVPIKKNYDEKFLNYTQFEKAGRTDLSEGKILVALINTECEHCQHTAYELARMQKKFKWFPKIYGLYFTEGQVSVDSFETITNFRIPYRLISASEFFNLVGQSPPRIYLLENGKVKEFWDNDFVRNIAQSFSAKK